MVCRLGAPPPLFLRALPSSLFLVLGQRSSACHSHTSSSSLCLGYIHPRSTARKTQLIVFALQLNGGPLPTWSLQTNAIAVCSPRVVSPCQTRALFEQIFGPSRARDLRRQNCTSRCPRARLDSALHVRGASSLPSRRPSRRPRRPRCRALTAARCSSALTSAPPESWI